MVNHKKRIAPIDPLDLWTIALFATEAAKVRSQHHADHPFRKARVELVKELRYLTEDRGYTPAQIAEETGLSYRSVRRYLDTP